VFSVELTDFFTLPRQIKSDTRLNLNITCLEVSFMYLNAEYKHKQASRESCEIFTRIVKQLCLSSLKFQLFWHELFIPLLFVGIYSDRVVLTKISFGNRN